MANIFARLLLLSFLTSAWCEQQSERNSCNAIPWLHKCEPNGYDKMTPPRMDLTGQTTPVKIEIYIESIGNFKAGTMDYDMDIYFVQHWRDSRLRHNHSTPLSFNSRALLDRLWVPDLYFANSKKADYNFVTVPNYVLKVQPNGQIRYSMRVSMKISCHMELQAYPIDSQRCYLKIVTYGSTTDWVNVTWITEGKPIVLNPDITDTDLKVLNVVSGYCDGSYFDMEFSCLLATIYLRRNIAFSLLQTFIPTTFIVCISWISFWIDPASVPGRVGLALTTLLTLSTQAIGMHYRLPPVGYAKAQDIWFGVCILFLFGALIEFALVNMYTRRAEHVAAKATAAGTKRRKIVETNELEYSPTNSICESVLDETAAVDFRKKAAKIDTISRIAFPVAFVIFCIIYWCMYSLVVAKRQEQ